MTWHKAFIIIPILLAACNKEENIANPSKLYPHSKMDIRPLPEKNTWNVEGSIFHKASAKWYRQDSLYAISFSDSSDKNDLILEFFKKPTGFGLYRVVYDPKEDDEVSLSEWRENRGHSGSEDDTYNYVKVADTNGVLTFTAIEVSLRRYTFVVDYNINCSLYLTE